MKILVISDIHANIEALRTVLAEAGDFDATWCLGDMTGYGPDPNAVIETLRALPNLVCLAGNHDIALRNDISATNFNLEARESLEYQRSTLTADNLSFLYGLTPALTTKANATNGLPPLSANLCHASPRNPIWEYVYTNSTAQDILREVTEDLVMIGHTHYQFFGFADEQGYLIMRFGSGNISIPIKGRGIINPGSVGQPRDRDPRAAFGILDVENRLWIPRRVDYDIDKVVKDLNAGGFPTKNADRLYRGI